MLRYTYITSRVNPHTYFLSKLRVARGYCTLNDYVCRSLQMTVVCTESAEECETAWLRQSLQTDHPLHQYVCLQNLYNYTTQKHYKDLVKTEFCGLQNVTGTKSRAPIIMRIPILHD